MLWISRARRSSEFTWRTFIFSNNLPEEIAGRNSNLKHVGLNRAKYFRLRCTLCEAFSSNNKISKLESLETKKNCKTNENYMKCKLSMNKHCRGNVLCRSLTDCQRNQIILEKNTHAGCNLCCLRLGLINSPVSFAVMRLRCKLVHDAEKYVRHCRHAHNINESKHLIKKLRSWQSQYLRYVAGNHRKCGNALNKVWHVVDDVQKK